MESLRGAPMAMVLRVAQFAFFAPSFPPCIYELANGDIMGECFAEIQISNTAALPSFTN